MRDLKEQSKNGSAAIRRIIVDEENSVFSDFQKIIENSIINADERAGNYTIFYKLFF